MVNISNTISSKLRNANVLFTILIVWLHVSANYDFPYWVICLTIYSVPCFFAISSFLYFRSFDFEKPWQDYKLKVIGRFKSLVIPFCIFNAAAFFVSVLLYKVHPVAMNPIEEFLKSNILIYVLGSYANGPLWYFLSLYSFVLVAPILGYIIRLSKLTCLLLPLFYLVCKDINYYFFPYWMVDIFIGAYAAIYYDEIRNIRFGANKFILGGAFLMSFAIIFLGCMEHIDVYTLRTVAPICFIVIYSVCDILPDALVKFLAPYSILVYCLHIPVSRITKWVPTVLNVPKDSIACLVTSVITILVIVGVGYILGKNRIVWKVVVGGR